MTLLVEHIDKWYGEFQVITDLSLQVAEGAWGELRAQMMPAARQA